MAEKIWEVINIRYCDHIDQDVGFEAQVVYPLDLLPDQEARVYAHRCSHAFGCNLDGRPSCMWAGTNPAIDPFSASL